MVDILNAEQHDKSCCADQKCFQFFIFIDSSKHTHTYIQGTYVIIAVDKRCCLDKEKNNYMATYDGRVVYIDEFKTIIQNDLNAENKALHSDSYHYARSLLLQYIYF